MPEARARLSAEMIRVRARLYETELPERTAAAPARWKEDAKLFAFTWAAGFVFFWVYLS